MHFPGRSLAGSLDRKFNAKDRVEKVMNQCLWQCTKRVSAFRHRFANADLRTGQSAVRARVSLRKIVEGTRFSKQKPVAVTMAEVQTAGT
jgi:hypothetical protein